MAGDVQPGMSDDEGLPCYQDELAKWLYGLPDASGVFTGEYDAPKPCVCAGVGYFYGDWVFKREPQCTCRCQSPDFAFTLHEGSCDAVPCPFCRLELSDEQ